MKKETINKVHRFLNSRGFRVILLSVSGIVSGCIFISYQEQILHFITRYISKEPTPMETITVLADYIIILICIFLAIMISLTTIFLIIDRLLVSKTKKGDH